MDTNENDAGLNCTAIEIVFKCQRLQMGNYDDL